MAYSRTQYSETMEIPQASRGFFIRDRDAIRENYGVEIFFPRNQCSGSYQTMVIKGGPIAISKSRVQLRQILAAANQEYVEYQERKSERRAREKQLSRIRAPSQLPQKPVKKPMGSVNPFALLEDQEEVTPTNKTVKVVKEEFPELTENEQARKERRQAERRARIAKRKGTSQTTKMDYAQALQSTPPSKQDVSEGSSVIMTSKMSWADMVDFDE